MDSDDSDDEYGYTDYWLIRPRRTIRGGAKFVW